MAVHIDIAAWRHALGPALNLKPCRTSEADSYCGLV